MDHQVDRLQRIGAARPEVIGLGGGLPAVETIPRDALVAAFQRAAYTPAAPALQYGWPEGNDGLRRWIAERLRARGAAVSAEDVIVTAGAQQALALAARMLLGPAPIARGARRSEPLPLRPSRGINGAAAASNPTLRPAAGTTRSRVVVDPESYPAALDLFRSAGAHVVTDAAPQPATCVYVMPGIANPRSNALTATRRAGLLALGVPIVADEAYAELRFDGRTDRPLIADARERTWHIGTLSKTLCPGLRIGWLVPPPAQLDHVLDLKHETDLQAGSLAQGIVEELLSRYDYDAHLARVRRFYAARADALIDALRRELPHLRFREPEGGFSVYVESDDDGDDTAFLALATSHGVSFDPGRVFRADDTAAHALALRICHSAADEKHLREGVRRLAGAWRAFKRADHTSLLEQGFCTS